MSSFLSHSLAKLAYHLSRFKETFNNMTFVNQEIFPLPPRKAITRAQHDHPYPPDDLVDRILKSEAIEGVGHIYVSSAQYCKETRDAEHEFLLFELQVHVDSGHDSRKNYILVDRVPKITRSRPPRDVTDLTADERSALQGHGDILSREMLPSSRGNIASSVSNKSAISQTQLASDLCYVSADRSRELAGRLGRTPYKCLSTMTFLDHSFTLEELLILADVLSCHRVHYDLFKTQCYWYAYMLWELVQRISKADTTLFDPHSGRGTHRYLPWLVLHSQDRNRERQDELKRLQDKFDKEWRTFMDKDLPKYKRLRNGGDMADHDTSGVFEAHKPLS